MPESPSPASPPPTTSDGLSAALPPMNCRHCGLGPYTIYAHTVGETPDAVSTCRREVRTFAPARTILREGAGAPFLATLYAGWAFNSVTLRDGRRQIFSFFIPGDTLVLDTLSFANVPLPYSIRSLTTVALCTFAVQDAATLLAASPDQRRNTEKALRRHLAAQYRHTADIGRRSAAGRLAQLIKELEERLLLRGLSQDGTFVFPPRQEHLADALGLTKVYVNRTLDRLRREDIVAFDRRTMTIVNRKRLNEIAEEE